jgi:regulator of CtrA degradation
MGRGLPELSRDPTRVTRETQQADGIVETGPLIERTYAEALDLTHAVRDYIAEQARHDKAQLDHDTQLVASCEEMRVTARMTQVMAWLMLQRAVQAGQVDRAETVRPDNRLGGRETCLAEPAAPTERLPDRLGELLQLSRGLYERIDRLDRMLEPAGEA